jgi:chitin disaccharide deacetylase
VVPTLIFNADDYGLSPGVSRGILEAAGGVVRSTTVMANFVAAEEAELLKQSGLACGAHLNISSGRPLTKYPQQLLMADGSFDKALALNPATWEDEALRAAVVAEWEAQLEYLYDLGLRIEHLDSHHHTHMVGFLFAEGARFAQDTDLPLRCRSLMRGYLRDVGVSGPDDLIETYFGAGNLTREALLSALSHAQGEIVEVMCHPGYVDDVLRERSGYLEEREEECRVLSDPGLAKALKKLGWQLGTYEELM